jgi:hypothetical protein
VGVEWGGINWDIIWDEVFDGKMDILLVGRVFVVVYMVYCSCF